MSNNLFNMYTFLTLCKYCIVPFYIHSKEKSLKTVSLPSSILVICALYGVLAWTSNRSACTGTTPPFNETPGSFAKAFTQDSRKFISLCFETADSIRVCIHNRSKVFVATASYENGCNFLRKLFLASLKKRWLALLFIRNTSHHYIVKDLRLKTKETPVD